MPASSAVPPGARQSDIASTLRRLDRKVNELRAEVDRLRAERGAHGAGSALVGTATMAMAVLGVLLAALALMKGH